MSPGDPGWDEAMGPVPTGRAATGLLEAEGPGSLSLDNPARESTARESTARESTARESTARESPNRRGAGAETEEQQLPLRLVQKQARRRAGRRRLLAVFALACVAMVGLALVTLHVLIAENQFRLDHLQQQASSEQATYEKLRLRVAQLEAPARIVSAAEGRLGMVQPASVTYLPPMSSSTTTLAPPTTARGGKGGASGAGGAAGKARPASPPTTGTVTAPQGDSNWPTIKPFLSGIP